MRTLSLTVALFFASSVQAQVSTIWGGTPRNLTFTPIDTSRAIGASNLSRAFKTQTNAVNPLNLSTMLPSLRMPSWPPREPQVSVLPQKQNPFQPNPIKGAVNPFNIPKKK